MGHKKRKTTIQKDSKLEKKKTNQNKKKMTITTTKKGLIYKKQTDANKNPKQTKINKHPPHKRHQYTTQIQSIKKTLYNRKNKRKPIKYNPKPKTQYRSNHQNTNHRHNTKNP